METQQVEQTIDYHSLPGLSNSRLKLLRKSPPLFKKSIEEGWQEDTKKHHIDGTLIDLMLLDYPKFQSNYIECTWDTPSSGQQTDFCYLVAQGKAIEEAYSECYKQKLKPDTLLKKAQALQTQLSGYIKYLRTDGDKETYDANQKAMIMAIQRSCYAHPIVSKLLEHPKKENHKVFHDTLLGELFKCEVDLFLDLGKVVWNVDLKSTARVLSLFPGEYRKYGYHKQQAIYHKLIRAWLDKQGRKDTRIRTVCLAVEKKEPHSAYLYDVHPRLLVQGWQWVKESVNIYQYHQKKGFDFPPRTYEKGTELIIPYDFDYSLLKED